MTMITHSGNMPYCTYIVRNPLFFLKGRNGNNNHCQLYDDEIEADEEMIASDMAYIMAGDEE